MSTITFNEKKHRSMWQSIYEVIEERMLSTHTPTIYDAEQLIEELKAEVITEDLISEIRDDNDLLTDILSEEEYDLFERYDKKFSSEIATQDISYDDNLTIINIEYKIRTAAKDKIPYANCYACQYAYEKIKLERDEGNKRCIYCPIELGFIPCYGRHLLEDQKGLFFLLCKAIQNDDVYTAKELCLDIKNAEVKETATIQEEHVLQIPDGWKKVKNTLTSTIPSASDINLKDNDISDVTVINATISPDNNIDITCNNTGDSINIKNSSTITGDTSVIIRGGTGNDVIRYQDLECHYVYIGGNDTIEGYPTADTLMLEFSNCSITSAAVNNNDIFISTNRGKIRCVGYKDKTIFCYGLMSIPFPLKNVYPIPVPNGWTLQNSVLTATVSSPEIAEGKDYVYLSYDEHSFLKDVSMIDASNCTVNTYIFEENSNISVKTGGGDDTIYVGQNSVIFVTGGHNIIFQRDNRAGSSNMNYTIYGYDSNTTICAANPISASLRGSDVILNYKSINSSNTTHHCTIKNAKDKKIGLETSSNSYLSFTNVYPTPTVTVYSGWDITSNTAKATISTAAALDLTQSYGSDITIVNASVISGGAQITLNNKGNSVRGGSGNDTIIGGTGNDTISLGSGADIYIYNGGNDLIQDYATVDSVWFNNSITSASISGSDLVINAGSGHVTIKGGKNKNVNVKYNDSIFSILNEYPELPYKGWQLNSATIKATVSSANDIDLTQSYGSAVKVVNASLVSSGIKITLNNLGNSVIGGSGSDTIYGGTGNDTISLRGGSDIYIYKGGNDLIQDYATVDAVHFNTRITSASLNNSNLVIPTGNGVVTIVGGKDKNVSVKDNTGSYTILNQYPVPSIDISGWQFSGKTAKATITNPDDIDLTQEYCANVSIVNGSAATEGIRIICNNLGNYVKGGSGNDTIIGGTGNDTISLGGGSDIYIYSGGSDVVQGYSSLHTIQFDTSITSASISGSDIIITNPRGVITVRSAKNKEISVKDTTKDYYIYNEYPTAAYGWSISGGTMSAALDKVGSIDLTQEYGSNVSIVNGALAACDISIACNNLGNSVKAGKGNTTIIGGTGNDTVSLGGGSDIYIYNGGSDIIQGYKSSDSIRISGSLNTASLSGKNVILDTSIGDVTVISAQNQDITIIEPSKTLIIQNQYPPRPSGWKYTSEIITASLSTVEDLDLRYSYGASVKTVNASLTADEFSLHCNNLGNSIIGGTGNNTIYGGIGNDSITFTGGTANVYVYNGGNNRIKDYTEGRDTLQFTDKINSAKVSGKDIRINTNSGSILVVQGIHKDISVVDSTGSFIIKNTYPKLTGAGSQFGWLVGFASDTGMGTETMLTGTVTESDILKGLLTTMKEPKNTDIVIDVPLWQDRTNKAYSYSHYTSVSGDKLIEYALMRLGCDLDIQSLIARCDLSKNWSYTIPNTKPTGKITAAFPEKKLILDPGTGLESYAYYNPLELRIIKELDEACFMSPPPTYTDKVKSYNYTMSNEMILFYSILPDILVRCYQNIKDTLGLSFTGGTQNSSFRLPQEYSYTDVMVVASVADENNDKIYYHFAIPIFPNDFKRYAKWLLVPDQILISKEKMIVAPYYKHQPSALELGIFFDAEFFSTVDSDGKLSNGEYVDKYISRALVELLLYQTINNAMKYTTGLTSAKKLDSSKSSLYILQKELPKWFVKGFAAIFFGLNPESIARLKKDRRCFTRAVNGEYTKTDDLYTAGYIVLKTLISYMTSKTHVKSPLSYNLVYPYNKTYNETEIKTLLQSDNQRSVVYGTIDTNTGVFSSERLDTLLTTPLCTKRMTAAEVIYAMCSAMKELKYNDIMGKAETVTKRNDTDNKTIYVFKEQTISGKELLDFCIKRLTYGLSCKFTDYNTLITSIITDINDNYDKDKNASDILKDLFNIVLDNEDTGAIIGSDALSGPAKSELDIVKEDSNTATVDLLPNSYTIKSIENDPEKGVSGFEKNYTVRYSKDFGNGVRCILPQFTDDFNGIEFSATEGTRNFLNLIATHIFEPSLKLIKDSYGLTVQGTHYKGFSLTNDYGNIMLIPGNIKGIVVSSTDIKRVETDLNSHVINTDGAIVVGICITRGFDGPSTDNYNPDYAVIRITSTYGTKFSDTTINEFSGKAYAGLLDRTFVHELCHAMLFANVSNIQGPMGGYSNDNTIIVKQKDNFQDGTAFFEFKISSYLPTWFSEGICELIHGIDQERKSYLKTYAKQEKEDSLKKVFSGQTNGVPQYAVGYMALRYLAKEISEATQKKFKT